MQIAIEFVSLNKSFRCSFHCFGGELQRVWISILSFRAKQIVIIIQRPIMLAIAEIEDEWTAEVYRVSWMVNAIFLNDVIF